MSPLPVRVLFRRAASLLACAAFGLSTAVAAPTAPPASPAKPAPAARPAATAKPTPAPPPVPIDGFQVPAVPANIAPTVSERTQPVEVVGQPRMAKGHPNTFWDQEDVDHYKELLKSNKELQIQFTALKAKMDERIAQPPVVPPPQKGPDGKWRNPGEYYPPFPGFPNDDPIARFRRYWYQDSDDVSDLGTVYALTGEAKYAEYAKKILLGRAIFLRSGPGATRLRSAIGITVQLLEEALILDHYVRGYDLIYNLPSWTPAEHKQMHDEFIRPLAAMLLYPGAPDIDQQGSFATQNNNRGLHGSVAVLASGYVTGDEELVNAALYGMHTTLTRPDQEGLVSLVPPHQDWIANTAADPAKGLLTQFYASRSIPGGMWVEGTPSYAFYALGSMIDGAEIAWHHGIDLYRHNNAIFKNMFDFPLLLSYPDLTTPGFNDAHRDSMIGGTTSTLYEYAYRRYKDPRYLAMINTPGERAYLATGPAEPTPSPSPSPTPEAGQSDPAAKPEPPAPRSSRFIKMLRIGSVPPSILYDLDPSLGQSVPPAPSVNYPQVGFGILRTPSLGGGPLQQLTLAYGPAASHGHPDKLNLDLYALGDLLMPSPGINFPYNNNPRIEKWYHTTLAHNTLTVDEKIQDFSTDARYRAVPQADQTVYAPAATVGLERAWTCSVYPGVTMDRAVFMTRGYVADLFGAFSATPHKYDLAWHVRGEVSSELKFDPVKFDPKVNGYNWFTAARQAAPTTAPWAVTATREGQVARLQVAAGPATSAIVGDGGIYVDDTSKDPTHKPTCPTIIERRENVASTVYGNALDYSGGKEPFVKGVKETGGLETGYGLLQVTTTVGTDLCFAAYRPGNHSVGGLVTDASQAFVQMNGTTPETLYLAGGKSLKIGAASITRSETGLAYVEKTPEGDYLIGNPSPTDAAVTVALPGLTGRTAYALDANGQKGAPLSLPPAGATVSLQLKAKGKVLFAK